MMRELEQAWNEADASCFDVKTDNICSSAWNTILAFLHHFRVNTEKKNFTPQTWESTVLKEAF